MKNNPRLTVRTIKLTAVLDPAQPARLDAPIGQPRITVDIAMGERVLTASLNGKSLRKAIATLRDGGDYACILQGKLAPSGNTIEEAGLAVQAKAPKAAASDLAAAHKFYFGHHVNMPEQLIRFGDDLLTKGVFRLPFERVIFEFCCGRDEGIDRLVLLCEQISMYLPGDPVTDDAALHMPI